MKGFVISLQSAELLETLNSRGKAYLVSLNMALSEPLSFCMPLPAKSFAMVQCTRGRLKSQLHFFCNLYSKRLAISVYLQELPSKNTRRVKTAIAVWSADSQLAFSSQG